jgi:hypothetical protein
VSMNSGSTVEDFALVLRSPATNEIDSLLQELCYAGLTACELVTMANVLRAAWERREARK